MTDTKIRIYSGLDTIGGVVMEVRYENCRAFFEAGMAYDPAFDMFDGKVSRRDNIVADDLWLNQIPLIDGIYRKKDIEKRFPDLKPAEGYDIDDQAFFVSHLHLDHMAMINRISPEVKIYMTKPAQILEKALEDVIQGVDGEPREYSDMQEETFIGKIRVKRFILNDDSYQDLSFYIETPDLKIHFTGDVFVYGKYRDNILKEIGFLKEKKPDLLFCEGTRFFSNTEYKEQIVPSLSEKPGHLTKKQLDERIVQTMKDYDGLIVFNYYEREMSDVKDFVNFAETAGRQIVYEPESAHLVNVFYQKKVNVMVPDTYEKKPEYLDEILRFNNVVEKKQILEDPKRYLVQNTYPNMLELFDYMDTHTLYLHHSGIPLGDFDPKLKNLMKVIEACGFDYRKTYQWDDGYFSPHAENYQILAYIEEVGASLTVPLHTSNRKGMICQMTTPHFYAEKNITYRYNKEKNILEADDE